MEQATPKIEAELGLDLVPLFEIALRRDIARSEGEGARFEAASALLEFIFDMRMAYYEHVAHRQRLAIEEELFELTRAAATTAQTLHEAGNITSLELFTREAARGEGRRAVFEARGAYSSSRRRLHHLMGLEERADHQRWEVLDALPAPESPRNVAQPTETSLAIAMQRREMHGIRDELRLTRRRGWFPELFVGVVTEYEDDHWKVGPSLRLALPLFDRQRYRADTLRAREMALHFRIDAEHRRLSAQVAELEERVELARELLRHIEEELLPLRGQIVAEALLHYNAMELSVFDLLEARRTQLNAERDRIDALLEFWRMRARQDFVGAGGFLNALD